MFPAFERARRAAAPYRLIKYSGLIAAMALALGVAGCGPLPNAPFGGPDPADATLPVQPLTEAGILGAYVGGRPVAPGSWRVQNERVAPRRQP